MLSHSWIVGACLIGVAVSAPKKSWSWTASPEYTHTWTGSHEHTWSGTGWGTWHGHSYTTSPVAQSTPLAASSTSAAVPDKSAPTRPAATTPSTSINLACKTVSSLVAAVTQTTAVPTVPAQIAWDCLNSVPLNGTAAVPWLQSLYPYLAWQTTLSYLKDPPSGYLEPAVDVYGLLQDMIDNVGTYANEYDFEFALYEIFQRTHDGHFRYLPTLMSGVLTFGRPLAVASYSIDGIAAPKAYVYSDVLLSANNSAFQPSAIVTVDGEDAITYLEHLSQYGSLQDPDALYNNVFLNLAQVSLGNTGSGAGTFAGCGRGAYVYPGAETLLTFENGTSATYGNYAKVLQDFKGIKTGQDIYNKYLAPPPATTAAASATGTPKQKPTPAPGYPAPVIRQTNNLVGGYYLDAAGYEDAAVLSVPSFVGLLSAEESFQQVAFDFIQQAKAAGKTKLIIDVSANGGGTILQGYSLFTNLFPDLIPYGATRFRAHQAFDLMGQVVSEVAGPVYPWNLTNPPGPDDVLDDFVGVPFDYRADVDEHGNNFDSWQEKYGPHEYNGDTYTSIIRWNLSDPTDATPLSSGIVVNGYQNRTGIVSERPFAVEDIVILYDGTYCISQTSSQIMIPQSQVQYS